MIVITAQAFPPRKGGIQNLLAGTADYCVKAGHEVLVLADGGGDARQWEQSAGLPYKVEWFSGPRPIRRWRKARRIKQLAKEGVIDALYADSWKSVEYLSGKFVFPVISWAHGNEFPNVANKALRIRKAFSKADHILFNSEDTRNRARAFTPETIGYSIVNPPIFKPEEPSRDDLDRTAKIWADHHPRLLSICRLIDWKGLDQAISALAAIRSRYPEAKLVIAGQGNDLDRLKGLAQSLGVSDSVDFIGWVEGGFKTALHRSADLFLQPGRQVVEEREGYGISYVEAALQGLPTISGNAGGAPEAIRQGESGLVIDATDLANVKDAILSVLDDRDRYDAMCAASRAHGEACLWENQIEAVLAPSGLKPVCDPAKFDRGGTNS